MGRDVERPEASSFTHLDEAGRARMVDVGGKAVTHRTARASACVVMRAATLARLQAGDVPKGDVLAAARIAGIQAAKRTPELIPLCHRVALSSCEVAFAFRLPDRVYIEAIAEARDRTGVEMEALTAASVAALTVYDMVKALDRDMCITDIRLEEKSGGISGDYRRA